MPELMLPVIFITTEISIKEKSSFFMWMRTPSILSKSKKSEAPNKPTKNFSVLSKYHMEIKPGLVDCCDKIRPINEKA